MIFEKLLKQIEDDYNSLYDYIVLFIWTPCSLQEYDYKVLFIGTPCSLQEYDYKVLIIGTPCSLHEYDNEVLFIGTPCSLQDIHTLLHPDLIHYNVYIQPQ